MLADNKNRKVVPRWRDFSTTVALGELSSPHVEHLRGVEIDTAALIASRYKEWKQTGTIWHAADVLNSAFVSGKGDKVADVAQFILANPDRAPVGLLDLASKILKPATFSVPELVQEREADIERRVRESIHLLKFRLHSEKRNAIAWTDLALLYVSIGQSEQAARAMRVACILAPENRFVLRSAGRLFLHINDPAYALRLMRQARAVAAIDPWLMAAEVSISSAAELPSFFAKSAKGVLDNESFSPYSKTELYSALGTGEMDNGHIRSARRLFRAALESPNENSLAQVQWADHKIGGIGLEGSHQAPPRSFEANGSISFYGGRWEEALDEGIDWLRDQPFSSRPAIFASYVGSSILERYSLSEQILRLSLVANPGNPALINNLAFALASDGRVPEAQKYLDALNYETIDGLPRVTLVATHGLVQMRLKNFDLGRGLYGKAKEAASALGSTKYRALASIFLAREEIVAGTAQAEAALKIAQHEAEGITEPDVRAILARVEMAAGKKPKVAP